MASGFTDYAHQQILNAIFGGLPLGAPHPQCWAGFIASPGAAGGGIESSQAGYARENFSRNQTNWPSATTTTGVTSITNAADIIWDPIGVGTAQTWVATGFFDSDTLGSGNLWAFSKIPSSQQPSVGNGTSPGLLVANGGFTHSLSEASAGALGGFTDYAHQLILNAVYGGALLMIPSLHLAAFTAAPTTAGGGTESSRASYGRVNIPMNATNWPAASGTVTASIANAIAQSFPKLGGSGTETWVALGLYDSGILGSGNLIWWCPIGSSQPSPGYGSIVNIPIGSIIAQLISTTP
jgi:hypothetical protein